MASTKSTPIVISAKRSYEYRCDEIRLTSLSRPDVVVPIQNEFQFYSADFEPPDPDFRPTARTFPPGLMFTLGTLHRSDGPPVPIRRLSVDYRRIVIEVAGPSSAIDPIFQSVRSLLDDVIAPDGAPAVGQWERTRDQSEIVIHGDFSPAAVLAPGLDALFDAVLRAWGNPGKAAVVPDIRVGLLPENVDYDGWHPADLGIVQFGLRTDRAAGEQRYFSMAPLDTDRHLAYLEELARVVSGGGKLGAGEGTPPRKRKSSARAG